MTTKYLLEKILTELKSIPDLELFLSPADKKKYSHDFFDYSPILSEKLSACIADVVVIPFTIIAASLVAKISFEYNIKLTLRGSGTGNYGQCVPLEGGIVMIMNKLRKIRDINIATGEVTVESGCQLRDLNQELVLNGRQLRLLPSTWRSASIGGFIAGGSGGIGSVRWGFLRDPGHLLGLEIITVESTPRILQLNARDSEGLNHAYGTNGIITALTLATAPLVEWREIIVDCPDWLDAVDLLKQCASAAIELYLCSLLEKEIVHSLPKWYGEPNGSHRLLLLVAPDGVGTVRTLAELKGADFQDLGIENLRRGKGLRELTWNHTTLHMRGVDKTWTYLQMLLPQPEVEMMNIIKSEWGENVLWHLEAVRQQGSQRIAALPIVRWQGKDLLNKLITQLKDMGAIIFNPHVITVEDGGLGVVDADQVQAKRNYDPGALLNPGKLKGWLLKE